MKKIIGYILAIGGLGGVIYFVYKYYEETQSINVFGADVTVTTGDIAPVIISALVMVIGIIYLKK